MNDATNAVTEFTFGNITHVLSPEGLLAAGKTVCEKLPRSDHGVWKTHDYQPDPIAILRESDPSSIKALLPIRSAECESPAVKDALKGSELQFGLDIARRIVDGTVDEAFEIFERLRRSRQLSLAVHEMNHLLDEPEHHDTALEALRRLGLEHSG